MEKKNIYVHQDEVHDSELDLQGIVNNANYFKYMEHCRHKHIKSLGIDFHDLHKQGYDLLLANAELSFKGSLRSGDQYLVTSRIEYNGKLRFKIYQEVIRKSDNKVIVDAINTATCVEHKTGQPKMPEELKVILSY